MLLRAGTSGFSYAAWKGPFYPEDAKDADLLALYAHRLPTVEINNTFYRMPRTNVVERWAADVPDGFSFVIKASQRITHRARLKDAGDSVAYLFDALEPLGTKLGPVLFQLPPNMKKDVPRLVGFLAALPADRRAVFEFRHDSWHDDDVHAALSERGAAACCADTDERADPPLVATADWGYLRLRREAYGERDLATWCERIRAQPWREAWAFFKHEDAGAAPRLARALLDAFAADA